ncbi:MAG: PIN domain-containing protein [Candidatus Hodarchaeales archaeon]
MPVLDTRFFIEFFGQKNTEKLLKLKKFAKQHSFVSVITLHELFKIYAEIEGIPIAEHRIRLIQKTYDIVTISSEIAISAARIRLHKKIPTADSLIGAMALVKDKIVVSDDPHFTMIKGLQVKWI